MHITPGCFIPSSLFGNTKSHVLLYFFFLPSALPSGHLTLLSTNHKDGMNFLFYSYIHGILHEKTDKRELVYIFFIFSYVNFRSAAFQ